MQGKPGANSPERTEDEWIVYSLNIQGLFLQRWCEATIRAMPPWTHISSEYPVEYPPGSGAKRGEVSALDLRAEMPWGDGLLTLLIECKKNNPDLAKWIFFPKVTVGSTGPIEYAQLITHLTGQSPTHWAAHYYQGSLPLEQPALPQVIADDAREVRANYRDYKKDDKTRTANNAISEAARQVALATQAIVRKTFEDMSIRATFVPQGPRPHGRHVFLPLIVTSARLYSCTFDPTEVDPATGEIGLVKPKLQEHPSVMYEYPLPPQLHYFPENMPTDLDPHEAVDRLGRMRILVVQSGSFRHVLGDLAVTAKDFMR